MKITGYTIIYLLLSILLLFGLISFEIFIYKELYLKKIDLIEYIIFQSIISIFIYIMLIFTGILKKLNKLLKKLDKLLKKRII